MRISVAMATFNGKSFVEEQLNSILSQTVLPDEIIISDDCSTDGTVELLTSYSKKQNVPITILSNKVRLGYTHNFERAIQKTTGDLVFLSDQDDVWFKNKIEKVLSCAQNGNKLVIIHDKIYTDRYLNPFSKTAFDLFKERNRDLKDFVSGSVMAIRKELLEMVLPIPKLFVGHDNWIAYHAQALNSVDVINTPLMYYRRHSNATMLQNNKRKIFEIFKLIHQHQAFLNQRFVNYKLLRKNLQSLNYDSYNDYIKDYILEIDRNNKDLEERNIMVSSLGLGRIKYAWNLMKSPYYVGVTGKFTLLFDFFGVLSYR